MHKLPYYIIRIKKLILSDFTGDWCKLPYPNHKHGCPKYNTSDICPPRAPKIQDYIDIAKPMYFVHSEFNLEEHATRMLDKHPNWTSRQCRCVLYWQSRSRKQLKERVAESVDLLKPSRVTACPEAMGINVFATCKLSGLDLERTRNIKICRHISLIGYI